MKRLKDFKLTERIPRPAVKVLSMQFGDDEAKRFVEQLPYFRARVY